MLPDWLAKLWPLTVDRVRCIRKQTRSFRLDPRRVSYKEAWSYFEEQRESYERLVDVAVQHLAPDGVLVDVGANIGYFSRLVMDRLHFRGCAQLEQLGYRTSDLSGKPVRIADLETTTNVVLRPAG